MNDLICIGSSICSKMARSRNVAFYKFCTLNERAVQELKRRKDLFKGKEQVLLFLNTNTLLPTERIFKGRGIAHTHRTRRPMRPNRLEQYLQNYKSLIEFLGDKRLFVVCNMGRCLSPSCSCKEFA